MFHFSRDRDSKRKTGEKEKPMAGKEDAEKVARQIMVGYISENGFPMDFTRIEVDPVCIKVALQLKQFKKVIPGNNL